jgi:hypothetical protein
MSSSPQSFEKKEEIRTREGGEERQSSGLYRFVSTVKASAFITWWWCDFRSTARQEAMNMQTVMRNFRHVLSGAKF